MKQVKLTICAEDSLIDLINLNKGDRLKLFSETFKKQLDNSINIINNLDKPKSDFNLKGTTLDVLNTYRNVLNKEYKNVIRIVCIPEKNYSKQDDELLQSSANKINHTLDSVLLVFVKAEQKFSDNYNIIFSEHSLGVK